ncbi:Phosphoenolpyruvate/phosphate translocator 2 isoform 2 [Hibiscus syriacus]|uniref:Phosphoenolpyruvate/phosphate translocator 2 isoform 2 n=1 Tax=Hibiscus syriacus TaxID=106335 RepID=A0A6A3BZ91_HIBSY|nr:Phosphoenolpyruvate/phosphate translocator 2 isoform 2 [Hibiscus syriacus]
MQTTALSLSPLTPLFRPLNKNPNPRFSTPVSNSSSLKPFSSNNGLSVRAQEVPENIGETKGSTGLATSLQLGAMFAIWYLLNIYFNIFNKQVLNLSYTVACCEGFKGVCISSYSYSLTIWVWDFDHPHNVGFKSPPQTQAYSFPVIIPLAVVHTLGNLLTHVSIGKVNVSFTHTIKAMEPFFTVLFSVLILGEVPFDLIYKLFLKPVLNRIGFCSAMASNVTNQSRNVFRKKFMVRNELQRCWFLILGRLRERPTVGGVPGTLLISFHQISLPSPIFPFYLWVYLDLSCNLMFLLVLVCYYLHPAKSCPSFRAHGAYRGRARQSGDKETRLRVCSLNVGTLNARLLELTDALNNRKIDFACIQETRWKGARARECNGYKLWYSGVDNARNRVGILVSSRLKENVVEVCRYRDRIMMIKVIIEEEVVNVLSVYAPHVGLGEGEKRCFWDQLDDVLRSIPEDQRVFIGGDFNGHIGSTTDGYDGDHGGFGYGSRNDEGRTLLEFATAHDLVIINSLFNKRDANLITFHSGGHCTQIDYILVRNRDRWACIDCKVSPEEACASQHKLLVLVFRVPHGRNTRRRAKLGKPRILWKKLHGATADDFRSKVLSNTGFGTTNSNNADLLWKNMTNSIREVGKNTLGLSTGKAKEHKESWWWNDEVQTKVKTKQTCFKEFLQCNDDEERSRAKQRYKEAKREAKKTVAKAKDKAYEEMYKRLDTKEGQNDIFRLAKSRENRKKDLGSIRFIKDNNDVLIAKDHDIKRVWGNYFFDLFNDGASPCRESTVDGSSDHHTSANDCPTSRIGFEEVKMALRKMGRDKAVGPDQIPITVWLALGEEGVKWLTNIFNIILETAKMPEEWRESTVIPIYKNKGDPQRCGNYRGIKLLSHTMKLWERVIEARLRQVIRVSENQFGFMPGRSTTEAIHLLRRLMEKYREKSRNLHMAFIDLEKAYDSVPRDTIWKTLETRRIPTIYIRTIRDMYCRSTTYVRTTVGDTEAFPVEIGLHQGSALSPYIFALIMDDIFLAETKSELNSRLANWKTALEEKGLRINIDKTEYLCSNFSRDQNEDDVEVCIEGHVLPSKDCFKYLGSMIHKDGGVDDDVTHRIKAGWLKWRAATGVLCDKKVPLKLKGKFYRMAIRPALLYGSECWATKKDHVRRIEASEMRMLRWTCGRTLWDMTTNSAIRMSLGVVPVSEKLREGRLRWFGHVLRRLPSDVVKRVESITVDGARRRGRPRRKWEDCLRSDMMDLALTEDMTSDRKVWRLKTRIVE